jgi:phosphoribosylformimino-5-aminoimidazole carboxamide ribotide isomerase
MQIWPAIDLLGGRCVRLQQGDYGRETVYDADPVAVARRFQAAGVSHLHLVDLDAARSGQPTNHEVVREIVAAVEMQCELGGGVRDRATIDRLLGLGLDRLVLGTAALKNPQWFRTMAEQYPDRLVLGIDAKNGLAATDGWLETSQVRATELADQFSQLPLAAIVYTDIATDGMLQGPNVAEMAAMQRHVRLPVVASGGVTTLADIRQLAEAGLAGAIIGRALYEGTIDLAAALAAVNNVNTLPVGP